MAPLKDIGTKNLGNTYSCIGTCFMYLQYIAYLCKQNVPFDKEIFLFSSTHAMTLVSSTVVILVSVLVRCIVLYYWATFSRVAWYTDLREVEYITDWCCNKNVNILCLSSGRIECFVCIDIKILINTLIISICIPCLYQYPINIFHQ